MPIRCEIATQDRQLFEGLVDAIIAPGSEGELGILPHHAPLLTSLGYGVLRLRYEGREEVFTIAGGFMDVLPDSVTILADVGENVAEIDIERAERARERAEELLARRSELAEDEFLAIEADLRRSTLRLAAVRRYQRTARRPLGLGGAEEE